MCQLTLVNTGSELINKIFLSTLLQLDSLNNSDGTGFLSIIPGKKTNKYILYKTELAADRIEELGWEIRANISSNLPIMGHVRAASKGIEVKRENSHPFDGERFILAHNGRLYKKDEEVTWAATNDDTSIASDSLVFLQSLDKCAKKNPSMPFLQIIQKTMVDYKGKFALLIYDKLDGKFYVCRGSSADLHVQKVFTAPEEGGELQPIGFIVNTKRMSLSDASTISAPIAQIATNTRIFLDKIEELDKESVYEVNGVNLVKLGELKENPIYAPVSKPNTNFGSSFNRDSSISSSKVDLTIPMWMNAQKISAFMKEHFLSVWDIDALMYMFLGTTMADSTEESIEIFVNAVIPELSAQVNVKNRLKKILDPEYGVVFPYFYTQVKDLEYPWMLNNHKKIDQFCDYLKMWKRRYT